MACVGCRKASYHVDDKLPRSLLEGLWHALEDVAALLPAEGEGLGAVHVL